MKSSTNYGTIPTVAATTATTTSTLRPWRELVNPHSLSRPYSYAEAMTRIRANLYHFRFNYSLILLIILFLTLIYHPFSMITFLIIFVAWVFLYFFRNGPIVVFNRLVDDRVVFVVLGFVTVISLVMTHVGINVLVGLVIGVFVVGLHAAFWVLDDGDHVAEGGLLSVVSNSDQQMTATFNRG